MIIVMINSHMMIDSRIGLPAARVLAERTYSSNDWTIVTVEPPRLRTLMNCNILVRVSLPWTVFMTRYYFNNNKRCYSDFDLRVFGLDGEPCLDSQLFYLNLPHCDTGHVCLGTAEDAIYEGLAPEDAFWNSDFVDARIDPAWPILGRSVGRALFRFLKS